MFYITVKHFFSIYYIHFHIRVCFTDHKKDTLISKIVQSSNVIMPILYGDAVENPIIDTGSDRTILLSFLERKASQLPGRKSALVESLGDVFLRSLAFCSREGEEMATGRRQTWQEFDDKVIGTVRW